MIYCSTCANIFHLVYTEELLEISVCENCHLISNCVDFPEDENPIEVTDQIYSFWE